MAQGRLFLPIVQLGVIGTKYIRGHTELAHILSILTCEPLLDSPYHAVTRLSRQGVRKKPSPDDRDIPMFLTCPHVSSHILTHPHTSSYVLIHLHMFPVHVYRAGRVKLAECGDTEGSTWMLSSALSALSLQPKLRAPGHHRSEVLVLTSSSSVHMLQLTTKQGCGNNMGGVFLF